MKSVRGRGGEAHPALPDAGELERSPLSNPFADPEEAGSTQLDEGAELDALAHAIRLSQGFKLFFVLHDGPAHRERLIAALQTRLPEGSIQILPFDAPVDHLLSALRPNLPTPRPIALCLTGLEDSIFDPALGPPAPRSSVFLANLNAARDAFPDAVGCPLLLWLTEYTVSLLARDAPDFFSVRSGYFRFYERRQDSVQYLGTIVTREDLRKRAQYFESLGDEYALKGSHDSADFRFLLAKSAYAGLGDALGQARVERKRAQVFVAQGVPALARVHLDQAEMLLATLDRFKQDVKSEAGRAIAEEEARILFEQAKQLLRASDPTGLSKLRQAKNRALEAERPDLAVQIEQSFLDLRTGSELRGSSATDARSPISALRSIAIAGAAALAALATFSSPDRSAPKLPQAGRRPTRASLRHLLSAVLLTDVDLMAFLIDFFPAVARRMSGGMTRTEKTNLLLIHEDRRKILDALREQDPERVQRYESLLEYEPESR